MDSAKTQKLRKEKVIQNLKVKRLFYNVFGVLFCLS